MSGVEDFKTRVQFSFSEAVGNKLEGEAAALYSKVAELFRTKRQLGNLNYWLLELAYKEASQELGLSSEVEVAAIQHVQPVRDEGGSNRQGEQAQPQRQVSKSVGVEPKEGQVEPQEVAKQEHKPSGFGGGEISVEPLVGAASDSADLDETDVDDMSEFLPLTLSERGSNDKGKEAAPRGKKIPKGISSLIHSS